MGDVYEAVHVYTRRAVAVKVMRGTEPEDELRFVDEAEAVSTVQHPAVVEMLDAGRDDAGHWYAVFELLDGEDLETLIGRGALTPADVVRVAIPLLDALAATHAAGYVHRDVKPANVFVARCDTGREAVKLLDFGIAARMDGPSGGAPALGHRVGTLEYMSPEQAHGEDVDGRTDLWSVGALMFRALTGVPPVDARHPRDVLRRLLAEEVPSVGALRPDLPDDLVEVIDRALCRTREGRWATAEDMGQVLRLVESAPLRALGPAPLAPASPLPFGRATRPSASEAATVDGRRYAPERQAV